MGLEISVGSRIRKSPFFEKTVEEGVTHFSIYNRTYMATSYGDPIGEYRRLVDGVSMWDVTCERQVALKGPDAENLTRYLTSRNLGGLNIGQGRYVPLVDYRGTIINDPVLLPISSDEYWLSIADSDILLWASAIAGERGMDVEVYDPYVSPLAVQGPKAVDVVAPLVGDWVRELKYFAFRETEVEGIPLVVAKSGWSKQGGYELYLRDQTKGHQLWDLVKEAGQPHGIGPGCPNYIERLESGLLSYGADTDAQTNPYEVGLGKYVDLDREDEFVGKQALKKIHAEGIKRQFVGFLISGESIASSSQHRWPILMDGSQIGFASAAAWSPRINSNIGVGLIETAHSEAGIKVTVCADAGALDATVVKLPFEIPE